MCKPSLDCLFIAAVLISFGMFAGSPASADEGETMELMTGFPPQHVVTKANWLTPPFNRWSFQHMEMLIPTATISRGVGSHDEMPLASKTLRDRYQRVRLKSGLNIDEYVAVNHVDGLLILKDGKIVAEHYANGQDLDTRHIMFSVGKSYTGILAETLVQDGTLDDTVKVAHYVPELANSGYGDATVRQVMDMLVDLEFSEDYADPYSDISQFIYSTGMGEAPEGVRVYPSLYAFLPSVKKGGEHGQQWAYVSATTETLGWIMNRASGKSWVELFEERVFRHLGARRDATIVVDSLGKEVAAGGMSMTLRDVGRFAYLVANDGRVGDEQVISADVVRKIKAGGDPDKFTTRRLGAKMSYKSQWYKDLDENMLAGYGIHGQAIQIGLDNGIIIITQSSWPVSGNPELWGRRASFQQAVFAALESRQE